MVSKYHPLQLNFKDYINSATLSDIKLRAISPRSSLIYNETELKNNDDDDILNLDDADDGVENDVIFAHWDILRARCVVFDLLFHAIYNDQCHAIPITEVVSIDVARNIITFDVSYTALLMVVKYLYTGILTTLDNCNLKIVHDVIRLADLLHLRALRIEIYGKFVTSRKHFKQMVNDSSLSVEEGSPLTPDDNLDNIEWYRGWQALKLDTFDVNLWRQSHENNFFFLNPKVLYHFDVSMYQRVASRQIVRVDEKTFQISKIVFVALSSYFKAMFVGVGSHTGGGLLWKESQHALDDIVDLNTDFVPMNAADFERLQRFLYTFDASTYYSFSNSESEHVASSSSSWSKALQSTMAAFHLSIYFGIDDLRTCLVSVLDQHFLCINSLHAIWAFSIEYEWKDIQRLCCRHFVTHFLEISMQLPVLLKLSKTMIKAALSSGAISLPTQYILEVLLKWANYHQTHIHDLLPPNTLFNEANKHFILSTRRMHGSISPQQLL
mmetsp:Transcript_12017/g.18137  ORF Transcript_12017/g.18137 Transcript_12017/m.18137 type:complete len:496 (-) Transcript_12017:82-1569(-)